MNDITNDQNVGNTSKYFLGKKYSLRLNKSKIQI